MVQCVKNWKAKQRATAVVQIVWVKMDKSKLLNITGNIELGDIIYNCN